MKVVKIEQYMATIQLTTRELAALAAACGIAAERYGELSTRADRERVTREDHFIALAGAFQGLAEGSLRLFCSVENDEEAEQALREESLTLG